MTDIFSLNEAASAVTTIDLPGGGKLQVAGVGTPAVRPLWRKFKEIEKAQLIRSAASQDGSDKQIMALTTASDKVVSDIAKAAVKWEGITSAGEPLDVTPENAVLVCGADGPFKRQMLNALAESEERFLGSDAG